MADLTEFNTEVPTELEGIDLFPSRIRNLSKAFKESFELDHSFGTSVDTTEIDCDGYHKQLTMPEFSGFDSETGNPITEPEQVTDGAFLFTKKIDGEIELCCENETGAYQMTSKGGILFSLVSGDAVTNANVADDYEALYTGGYFYRRKLISGITNIYRSTDGETWSLVYTCDSTYKNSFKLQYLNGKIVFLSYPTYAVISKINYSDDGVSWNNVLPAASGYTDGVCRVTYFNGLYIFLFAHAGDTARRIEIYTSPDLTTWTQRYNELHYEASRIGASDFFITGTMAFFVDRSYRYSTTDGVTWSKQALNVTLPSLSISEGNSVYYTYYSSGTLYSSSDGLTWTARGSVAYLYIRYNNGYYYYMQTTSGGYAVIYRSTDLTNWTSFISNVPGYFRDIYFTDGTNYTDGYICIAYSNSYPDYNPRICWSYDLEDFETLEFPETITHTYYIAFKNTKNIKFEVDTNFCYSKLTPRLL